MFCMMSVVVVASAAIPSLCLLHRGPGRHVAADRGRRLLGKWDNKIRWREWDSKKSEELFRPNFNLLVILLCMQRRTQEQSERRRPWDCHDSHKTNETLDGNGDEYGELEIMMMILIEIEDGNPPKGRLAPDHPLTLNISSSPIDFHYLPGYNYENVFFDEVDDFHSICSGSNYLRNWSIIRSCERNGVTCAHWRVVRVRFCLQGKME